MNKVFVFFAIAILGFSNIAAAATFECPPSKNRIPFNNLSIFDGNPKEKADLAPDNADSPFPHKWTLNDSISPWLVCSYGSKNQQLFKKKLTQKLTICETFESKKKSGKHDSIKCH